MSPDYFYDMLSHILYIDMREMNHWKYKPINKKTPRQQI